MPFIAPPNMLNVFQQHLMAGSGVWKNQAFPGAPNGEGGEDNPLSYCVMPLPQNPPDFILKNFTYYETLQFEQKDDSAPPAGAPNRGSDTLQVPTALFYNQNVQFAEGPGQGQTVHVENGAWLNLQTADKLVGPYPPPPGSDIHVTEPNLQPPDLLIAKQVSVPHGNSILALGSFDQPADGSPNISDSPPVLPTPAGLDTSVYSETLDQSDNYQNPQPNYTQNPNAPLQQAVSILQPNKFITWNVTTKNQGSVVNIPFETQQADVIQYDMTGWLLSTDGGSTYPYFAYSQTITMVFKIGGTSYHFPHVTTNVVTLTS